MTIHKAVFEVEIDGEKEVHARALAMAIHVQFAYEAKEVNKCMRELRPDCAKVNSVTLLSYE